MPARFTSRLFASAAFAAMALAGPAHATFFSGTGTPGTVTNPVISDSTFDAAVTGEEVFGFGPVTNGTLTVEPGDSLTTDGLTFSGGNNLFLTSNTNTQYSALRGFSGTYLFSQSSAGVADVITIDLNTQADAIAFNFGNHNRNQNIYQFAFTTAGGTFTMTDSFDQVDDPLFYLGFVSTTGPITSVTITDERLTSTDTSNDDIDITGFRVADLVTPVPEPATLAVFGAGLMGIAGFVSLRRRKTTTAQES